MILECPDSDAGLYHIVPERSVVEILRIDGTPTPPGEVGEIVTTDLHNYAMPFIRYRTGDSAVLEDRRCSCGREFPAVRRIEGRIISALKRCDGTTVTGLVLSDAFEQLVLMRHDCVYQYCIVQNADLSVKVMVVAGGTYDDTVASDIRQRSCRTSERGSKLTSSLCPRYQPAGTVNAAMWFPTLDEAVDVLALWYRQHAHEKPCYRRDSYRGGGRCDAGR